MKRIFLVLSALATILIACTATQNNKNFEKNSKPLNDTIRISNEEIEYEVIIIDPGFASWLTVTLDQETIILNPIWKLVIECGLWNGIEDLCSLCNTTKTCMN